jgi:Cu+-exporting ATPase
MPVAEIKDTTLIERQSKKDLLCYHCGVTCINNSIAVDNKIFCCEGCKLVYEILNENGLCNYYNIQSHPGLTQIKPIRNDKYSYLDNEQIAEKLYKFTDGNNTIVTFYIPGVHCSSCMWLLEHLPRLNKGISESRLNFTTKEITIHFAREQVSIRTIVELLTTIGYEPFISLDDSNKKKAKNFNRIRVYKLGVAGFCFGNIMMMSFPEYLSATTGIDHQYAHLFRYFNLLLALPAFFYSASEFFVTAWKGLKQKMLNIDTPIAVAIIITFLRSIYEITTNTGAGYLDSMSGIVFFMLVGRLVQERTYKSLSFHRDYKSYFPIAVNVITPKGIESKNIQDLAEKDLVQLHNDEVIPADAIIVKGKAYIDYSFVTGESDPVAIETGKLIYAGGKQRGEGITIQIVKPVAGSYLVSLWNHYAFSKNKAEKNDEKSVIHIFSKYFTWIILTIALLSALYWAVYDPSKIINSVSAILIVACPCALLLSATYTNGNLLRIFSDNGLFLRDATVIEQLKRADHIVFDKTGTLTHSSCHFITSGHQLNEAEKNLLYATINPSKHPYSRTLANYLGIRPLIQLDYWSELPGQGLEATSGQNTILIGSAKFIGVDSNCPDKASVYTNINGKITSFYLEPDIRESIPELLQSLNKNYRLSLLSGDNDRQKNTFQLLFGKNNALLFEQKPIDKLNYIENLQKRNERVIMIGDGLNDSGALQQSDVGITLADDINNFTPSCDAILDSKKIEKLPQLLKLSKLSSSIINLSFAVSIVYNIIGLFFAVQGKLQPVNAAILMPCSTISIVLISTGVSSLVAHRLKLSLKSNL